MGFRVCVRVLGLWGVELRVWGSRLWGLFDNESTLSTISTALSGLELEPQHGNQEHGKQGFTGSYRAL